MSPSGFRVNLSVVMSLVSVFVTIYLARRQGDQAQEIARTQRMQEVLPLLSSEISKSVLLGLQNRLEAIPFGEEEKNKIFKILLDQAERQLRSVSNDDLNLLKDTIKHYSKDDEVSKRVIELLAQRALGNGQPQGSPSTNTGGSGPNETGKTKGEDRTSPMALTEPNATRKPSASLKIVTPSGSSPLPEKTALKVGVLMVGDADNEIGQGGLVRVMRDLFTKAVAGARPVHVKPARSPGFSTEGLLASYVDVRRDDQNLALAKTALDPMPFG
jgi:hypothetical protein